MNLIWITPVMQWMVMLMSIAIIISVFELLAQRKRFYQLKIKKQQLRKVEASAVVLNMEETGVFMDSEPLIRMQMRVITDMGQNFVLEIKEVLSFADRQAIRNGSLVRVRYNPVNRGEAKLVKTS